MRIDLMSFRPVNDLEKLGVVKNGDILTINGEAFNFTSLPDGGTIPAGDIPCPWIFGPVERIAGALHLTLRLPFGPSPEAWQLDPEPLINVPDGPVDLPTDTVVTVVDNPVPGGVHRVTTTKRWHRVDEVVSEFIPTPQENANVDA